MQQLKVSMQLSFISHTVHDHVGSMEDLPKLFSLTSSSPSPSFFAIDSSSLNFYASRTELIPNLCSFEKFIKLCFQQVVIHPKWTPDERVMLVLLRHYILSQAEML